MREDTNKERGYFNCLFDELQFYSLLNFNRTARKDAQM